MDRIEQARTSGHAKRKWTPLPDHTKYSTKESDTKTRKRRRACPLTKSVYTPRALLAAHSHVDQPTKALAANTVNTNAAEMPAEQTRPDNGIT
jgi:hypothetical protein